MKLSELAYRRFKEQLFGARLRPGQFVSQRQLARSTGVPLAPVREALWRLAEDGLVRIIPQRGVQVIEVSPKLIRDAFQLRAVIEKEAAGRYAGEAPAEAIEALDAAHAAVLARADGGIDAALLALAQEVDWRLHDEIVDHLGNALIQHVHEANKARIHLIRLDSGLLTAATLRPAFDEHLAVIAAFRRRDPQAAAAAIEAHLQTAMRRALGV